MNDYVVLVLPKSACSEELIVNSDIVVNVSNNQPVPVKNRGGELAEAVGDIIEHLGQKTAP